MAVDQAGLGGKAASELLDLQENARRGRESKQLLGLMKDFACSPLEGMLVKSHTEDTPLVNFEDKLLDDPSTGIREHPMDGFLALGLLKAKWEES